MPDPSNSKTYPVAEAVRAQAALRDLAGLGPEMFPVQAFIGMISDEIETLRSQGHTDEEIAHTIQSHSDIVLTAQDIAENYASPEQRHSPHS
jgi:hypothetical protein